MVAKWLGPVLNSETIVLALLEPAGEIKNSAKRWGTEERREGVGRWVDLMVVWSVLQGRGLSSSLFK